MDKKEYEILLNFLKSGMSTRELDKLLGHNNSKGWISWKILKKYKLKNSDKGKLFLYKADQSKKIIKLLIEKEKENYIDELISNYPPNHLEKYRDSFVISKSVDSFHDIISGQVRNITRDFFNPKKKIIGKCQFKGCNKTQLDAHHYSKNRPQIFKEGAELNKEILKNKYCKFDVYKTMKSYLEAHKGKGICFLCKKHHTELHNIEKSKIKKDIMEFKRKIIF
jgi:hypothetical protein